MPDAKEAIPESNLTKRISETKSMKSVRRVSRLPKCTPIKSMHQKGAHTEGNETPPSLDFCTRMKLKDKISELQQMNNELRFKLTTSETKLKAKDSELIAAESLNKQIKHLLDKHINREQELNTQILNLEKKLTKVSSQLSDVEEGKSLILYIN